MNERIKELALQAEILITDVGVFHNTPTGAYQLKGEHLEKFAELIVQECVGIDFRQKIGLSSDQDYEVSNTIKQHFGVK